jgi:DNA-binding GntR family transcriptional regulator
MSTATTKPGDGSALVDDLAARIRDQILSGAIPLGKPLRQADLAEQFGISRTPVREALRQLQTSGLIEIHPHRGAVVRVPVPWEVRETYEVRAALEALAARRAATRLSARTIARMRESNDALYELAVAAAEGATPMREQDVLDTANDYALHSTIHEAAMNARLQHMLNDIHLSYPRNVPAMLLRENAQHREGNYREHVAILDALAAEDGDLAARLRRQHVISTGEQVARWYEQHSGALPRS